MKLGTILPTRESLAAADDHADRMDAERARIAAREFPGQPIRMVGGEARIYRTPAVYAVVGRDLRIRWFEHRADGDWPLSHPA